MTYRQAKELGAQVRKGEKGSLLVYANSITKTEKKRDVEREIRPFSGAMPEKREFCLFC